MYAAAACLQRMSCPEWTHGVWYGTACTLTLDLLAVMPAFLQLLTRIAPLNIRSPAITIRGVAAGGAWGNRFAKCPLRQPKASSYFNISLWC